MIPVFKPSIKRKDMDGVLNCLISDSIGFGEKAREFIGTVSDFYHLEYGTALRDYSLGLGLALDSLEMDPGSKVIISPLSPDFYYRVIEQKGFEALYADIDPLNGCMDPQYVKDLVPLGPSAILLHFPLGFIPDLRGIKSFGLPVIADISTVMGSSFVDNLLSDTADIVILNLEEDGIITAGGGVLVMTPLKPLGIKLGKLVKELHVSSMLSDINASLGLIQFYQMESFIEKRRTIDEIFSLSVMKGRHARMVQKGEGDSIPFSFPVLIEGNVQGVRQYARKKNISTFLPFETSSIAGHQIDVLPCRNAVSIMKRCLIFPLYPSLSRKNIEVISKVLSTLP